MISAMNEQLRRIVIAGSIKEDTAAHFLEQLTALECMDINKPISIYIDTYGGNVDAAMSMYDAIRACCCPIVTIGIGKVMSAGVLLLAAGDRGNRFITQNTRVMIHQISGGTFGPVSEMAGAVEEISRVQDMYIDLLSKDSGTSKSKLLRDMKKETFMSAEETVKYGIVDRVVPTRRQTRKAPPKKSPVVTNKKKKIKKALNKTKAK